MSYDVTVIGEIYLDHVFSGFAAWPSPGEEIFTDEYAWELGGGAITTACALSRLGRSVRLIGAVGQAQFPLIQQRLAEFGVSAEHLIQTDGRTGVTVSISTTEDRSFFTYRGVNDQLTEMLETSPDLLRAAAQAHHIHLALPLRATSAERVVPLLKAHGATTSLDVGHHLDWLHAADRDQVLALIDYLMPNEKEAEVLAGSTNAYLELCQRLHLQYAMVKVGAKGAVLRLRKSEYSATPPRVTVVDTTGAGDAFDAGFIDGLLAGLSPQQCLERGCVCGSLSTRAAGALAALPTAEEAAAVAQENYAS